MPDNGWTAHVEKLMALATAQVDFAIRDCLRHAHADMGTDYEHDSHGIILGELKSRISKAVDEHDGR